MPCYFFHARDRQAYPDKKGTELADIAAARVEAARLAALLLKEDAQAFWAKGEWTLNVTDDTNLTLFTLHLMAIEAPAIRRNLI